jgi:hypothetical protein
VSERFKDGASGDLARLLFESTEGDAPPPGAHGRALAALGVGSAMAASTVAGAAAAPKGGTLVTGAAIAKWVAIGAGTAFLTVGTGAVVVQRALAPDAPATVMVTRGASDPERPYEAPRSNAMTPPPIAPGQASFPAAPAGAAVPREARMEPIPLESLPRVTRTPGKKADAPANSDLALEVESLDRVRTALASSDASSALRELDAFSGRFPSAALAPEATVLRVQALLESGHREAAERLARRFIAASPGSPHAARVRLLIEGSARPKARFD